MTLHDTQGGPDFFWFLPTHGDGRYLGSAEGGRVVDLAYLKQVAIAADSLGYEGVLIPTGTSCEDAWLVAAALAPMTTRLRFLVAVRPGLQPPTLAARMTATLDRLSDGRALINVVAGGDPVENRGDGIFMAPADRYRLTREYLTVYRRLLEGERVDFHGEHVRVEGAQLTFLPVQSGGPPLYFGGSSPDAVEVAGDLVDSYLSWGEPPADVGQKFAVVRDRAAMAGRTLSYGVRLHVIVRETEDEAWREAERLIERLDDSAIASVRSILSRLDSAGQQRMKRAARLLARQIAHRSASLGWRGPRARGRRHGAGRQPGAGGGSAARLHGGGCRPVHPLRLSASGGGAPLRRAGDAADAVRQPPRPRGRPGQYRSVRRRDRAQGRAGRDRGPIVSMAS